MRKVGINLKAGKNLVGAFHQPKVVLCDLETLTALPDREFRSGLAEVIKYGVIRDAELFRRLEREMDKILKRDAATLANVISRCCAIKAEVVASDETESGPRALLNFGHTVGHGLEAISGYGEYLHGEAISIGQVAAARLSTRLSTLTEKDADRIRDLLVKAGSKFGHPEVVKAYDIFGKPFFPDWVKARLLAHRNPPADETAFR